MKPALVTVVCPVDNDVIADMLLHYYRMGIRNFYLMLHKPDIELERKVDQFRIFSEVNTRVFTEYNLTDEHNHDQDAQVLINKATKEGCDWIIASDADEILILKKHLSIIEFLKEYDFDVIRFKWVDMRGDDDCFKDAFTQMKYRCKEYMDVTDKNWLKSCGKFNADMRYLPGFHDIINVDDSKKVMIPGDVAEYRHYPERNFLQFRKKIMMQKTNWLRKYGYFYMDADLLNDPNFLEKIWVNRLITTDGQRLVCKSDKYNPETNVIEYEKI